MPRFTRASTDGLPEATGRWLRHAIAEGTPLHRSAALTMHGEIRIGSWRPFTARQVIVPGDAFVWQARTSILGLPVRGFDRFVDGVGEMRWRLAGVVPVMSARDDDVARSAAGRLAGEGALVPTAFGAATWTPDADPDAFEGRWRIAGDEHAVRFEVGPDGRLRRVTMDRWGDPDGRGHALHHFVVTVDAEATFHGVTMPGRFRASWWAGTDREADGEFFRATVTDASFV
ncbi:DUF6920 family protein [Cellulomonas septica]|uniref:DUF6920 family protein n=1 Tax=Cellulomonas septica TaxID=285080 RepID=UPI001B345A01|nr:DUF6544 family protein [Cellulomonas septica]